tara:strand:- start:417 stop:1103 length:687 start_codon:yes stop_codon:yes gene_type:complete
MGDCVAIIPARGGSKGIPGKNTLLVAGKPLIAWSIEQASRSAEIHSVWVTSDSHEILDIANTYGAQTILRPANISGDKATSEEAWIHALNEIKLSIEVDLVVCMQPTSPIRGRNDLDEAIAKYRKEKFDSLLSVTQIEDYFEWRMGKFGAESINYDYTNRKRRQDIEVKYLENGSFYIVSPEGLIKNKNRLGGYVGFYEQEKYKMYQIDNISDVALCEAILIGYGLND